MVKLYKKLFLNNFATWFFFFFFVQYRSYFRITSPFPYTEIYFEPASPRCTLARTRTCSIPSRTLYPVQYIRRQMRVRRSVQRSYYVAVVVRDDCSSILLLLL